MMNGADLYSYLQDKQLELKIGKSCSHVDT